MGGFLIAVARRRDLREAITDAALAQKLVRRADWVATGVERWTSEGAAVLRFHGSSGRSQSAGVGRALGFDHLAGQFERFTDATLELDHPVLKIVAPPATWRTLWICQDDRMTVVATSLRHCAYLLGGLQVDDDSPMQFLITGTLGPQRSWDRRVRQLRPGEQVEIDIGNGELRVMPTAVPVERSPRPSGLSDADASEELATSIRRVLSSKLAESDGWVLPLSGGHDSRGLLLMLPQALPTITWGSAASRVDRRSDSWVAAELASATGVSNRFIEISDDTTPPDVALARFVDASEGRIDHIDAYTDGLESWRSLAADGLDGVLRGDECFGWVQRRTELGVRRSIGALGPNDLVETARTRALADRDCLWQLPRSPDRSLAAWRDELYRSFRVPSVLAPLTEVKANFVDVVCPLLAPRVVAVAAGLRDDQRTDKRIFAELVQQLSPPVPFATRSSLPPQGFAARDDVRAMLSEQLSDRRPSSFDPDLVRALAAGAAPGAVGAAGSRSPVRLARRSARAVLPQRIVRRLARSQLESPVALNDDTLRLRLVLADSALSMLEEWGAVGREFR